MVDKITIFKEVFDYYYDGEITKEQLADLLLMHYETRWGNGVDVKEIEDKDLRMIWRTLQHSVIKSTKNAKQYERQQNKKSALQDTVGTEFDIPKSEIENKPVLDAQIVQDDNQYQPTEEKPTEELKTPNKDITHMTPINDMDNMETTPISTDDIEEEFETDEQKYGSRVMDFVDRYYDILENIVKAKVINTLTPTAENSLVSQSADIKLKNLVIEYGFTDDEKPHLIQLLNDWRDETISKQNEVVAA